MAWPTFTPLDKVRKGSGFLLAAPEGTAVPTITAVDGELSATFDPAWKQVGRTTEDGITINHGQETTEHSSSQEAYPYLSFVSSKSASVAFTLVEHDKKNLKLALNGGNWSTTSSGATQVDQFTPANPGDEEYAMLAWIGPDNDELYIFYKTYSSADVEVPNTRDDPRPIPLTMTAVLPDDDVANRPFHMWVAGGNYDDPA